MGPVGLAGLAPPLCRWLRSTAIADEGESPVLGGASPSERAHEAEAPSAASGASMSEPESADSDSEMEVLDADD